MGDSNTPMVSGDYPTPETIAPQVSTSVSQMTPPASPPTTQNTTTNAHTLLSSFHFFRQAETLRMASHRRRTVKEARAAKFEELRKFGRSFNIVGPIPEDLLPLLAKEEWRQSEIAEKQGTVAKEKGGMRKTEYRKEWLERICGVQRGVDERPDSR